MPRGLRLRPRVAATIEVESGTNDPFAVFLTVVLVEILLQGTSRLEIVLVLVARSGARHGASAIVGGARHRLRAQPRGAAAGAARAVRGDRRARDLRPVPVGHASGFLAVYLAGLIVGNRAMRARTAIIAFLDAVRPGSRRSRCSCCSACWSWPQRLPRQLLPALGVALMLMLVARPAAVFLSLWPFRFSVREKLFISWVGLRGAVGFFLASMPLLVGLQERTDLFRRRLHRGAGVAAGAGLDHRAGCAAGCASPRSAPRSCSRASSSICPGQRAQELVGYPVTPGSPYLRGGICRPGRSSTLVVRDEKVMTPEEARGLHEGDHVYLLAPQEKATALDRFFANLPPPSSPDPRLLGDFFVAAMRRLAALAEIYGITVEAVPAAR